RMYAEGAPLLWGYLLFCAAASIYFVAAWVYRVARHRTPPQVVQLPPSCLDVQSALQRPLDHGWFARMLSLIPGNQVHQVSFEEASLTILPAGSPLAGLRICHLSAFHFTGALDRAYFEFVVDRVNEWQPDLVLLTGDVVDEAHCLDWVEPVFGKLRATHGKFYVLGNHDRRIEDEWLLRSKLMAADLSLAGGRWNEVHFRGGRIGIAGNELPWYGPATTDETRLGSYDLTIALMHSPDQIHWAESLRADLAFAGHLHGGQICLPLVGAIIAPSKFGVRYVPQFHNTRNGLLIVSRGLSGDEPIRILCQPHVGLYVLQPTPIDSHAIKP
ncbi:MAG TPA: metallophosphoesterase, partial [Pirellulaceae bacterium]|nr:metallophosphoesterase [Pirellulaceae bacterium]